MSDISGEPKSESSYGYLEELDFRVEKSGFKKQKNRNDTDASITERTFSDRRVKTLSDGKELHLQISNSENPQKQRINIDGASVEVSARFWVVDKNKEEIGKGTSQCYVMDKDGNWYFQAFETYTQGDPKGNSRDVDFWRQTGQTRRVDIKAVEEGVFDRISGKEDQKKFDEDFEPGFVKVLEKQEQKESEKNEKVEYKPRTWNDTRYIEDEFRESGNFKLIRADNDPNKRDSRDKIYPRRLRGSTKDGSIVELQMQDGTETEHEKYTFEKNGKKVTDEVIFKIWVMDKPKTKAFNKEKGIYEDRFEQTATCYVLTKENGWLTQYGSRTGGAGIDYLDYNKNNVIDRIARSNSQEGRIWNEYQSSTVDPEPLLQTLQKRLAV